MNKIKTPFFENKPGAIIVLVLITYAVYLKSLFFDFSPMDEDWLIIRNESFIKDWDHLIICFKDAVQGLYYRPMLIVSFIIDYHIGHLDPFIYHFTNLLIHALCVVTLYKLLLELKTEKTIAFFLAALFSVHPIALHAVAWIPGRNDLLLCLFTVLSCYHLIRFIQKNKYINAIGHFIFFMLALFSKENAVFLLPIFVFIFFIPSAPNKKKLFLFGLIWLAQTALWYFLLSSVIKTSLTSGHDLTSTIKGFLGGFLIFIGKSLVPINQSVTPNYENSSLIMGIIVIILLSISVFKLGVQNKRTALLGLLIYFILLAVPVWFGATSPLGEHLEHRSYTSLIGLMVFLSQIKWPTNSKLVTGVFAILITGAALKTFTRMAIYKDGLSYLTEAAVDCPKNYFFHARKGNFLFHKGQFADALDCYNTAISLYDKKPQVYNDRANVYVSLQKKNEAIADYTKALDLSGNDPQILSFRCQAYYTFGDFENAYKDLVVLKQCCANSIPAGLEGAIINNLYNSQLNGLNKLIVADPSNAILYVNRAKFFIDRRMGKQALSDLKKACELEPKNTIFRGYFNELNSSFPR